MILSNRGCYNENNKMQMCQQLQFCVINMLDVFKFHFVVVIYFYF